MQFNSSLTDLSVLRSDLSPHSELEAWTLAFSPARHKKAAQSIYSGGDDSKLRCVTFPSLGSLRSSAQDLATISPGGTRGMPGHDAGVTAILPLPLDTEAGKDILVTGSYDDNVRVYASYDYREGQGTKPKVLAELYIGGGVWRLKFIRDYTLCRWKEGEKKEEVIRRFRILASCMHAGARVLEVKGSLHGEWTIEILASFEDHKSMNYGSDVMPTSRQVEMETQLDDSKALCVSTSFYDRLLCVWRFNG
jgi:diphthamide biosynthesis protein 7